MELLEARKSQKTGEKPVFFIFWGSKNRKMKQISAKIRRLSIVASAILLCFFAVNNAFASQISAENVVKLVNEARKEKGLKELRISPALAKIAQDKAGDMLANDYFAHTSPKGATPWYWFQKNKYDYHFAGENLAIDFVTAEDQQAAWMKSPTHKKNILNDKYEEIGVAVAAGEIGGKMSLIAVQEFGTLMSPVAADKGEKVFNAKEDPKKSNDEKMRVGPAVLSVKDSNDPTNLMKGKNLMIGKRTNNMPIAVDPSNLEKEIIIKSLYNSLAGMAIFVFILIPFLLIGKMLKINRPIGETGKTEDATRNEASYLAAMEAWNERNADFHSR